MHQSNFSSPILEAIGIENLPSGNNIILTGPPGVGKSVFCENLMSKMLEEKMRIIYTTLDSSPNDIRNRILIQNPRGHDKLKTVTFIDAYSWLLGEASEDQRVPHLSNLNDLSVKIFNAINEPCESCHVVIFDSISTLFIYNSENDITRFIQVNMARIKHSGSMGFWTIGEGIHPLSFYNFLRHLSDGVIEMRLQEDQELKRFIRVHTLKGLAHKTNWLPFDIQGKGELVINPK